MFGYSMETIYLTVLIVIGCTTILYFFLADVVDVSIDGVVFLDPAVILSFISFMAAAGYLLERFTPFSNGLVVLIAIVIACGLTVLLYVFLLLPIRSAEVSLVYTEKSLEGQIGKVIVPIPVDGFGEIVIESVNGMISKRAASYHNVEIPYDKPALIIEIKESTAYVVEYDKL